MRILYETANAEYVVSFAARLTEIRRVQGVVVTFDPFWLALWDLRERGIDDQEVADFEPEFWWLERLRGIGRGTRFRWMLRPDLKLPDQLATLEPSEYDPSWQPPAWRRYADLTARRSPDPREIIVSLRPGAPSETAQIAAQAREIAGDLPLETRVEVRPVARLHVGRWTGLFGRGHRRPAFMARGGQGLYVPSRRSAVRGTLGGLLQGKDSGRVYGTTSGHVAELRSEVFADHDLEARSRIGQCVASVSGPPMPLSSMCNPYVVADEVDASLIEIDPALPLDAQIPGIGRVTKFAAKTQVSSRQSVEMLGAASGHCAGRLGGVAATYSLAAPDGSSRCYRNLFEIHPVLAWWEPEFASSFKSYASAGDSGSWIVAHGEHGAEAVGILVGSERTAYASYFDSSIAMLASALGESLQFA